MVFITRFSSTYTTEIIAFTECPVINHINKKLRDTHKLFLSSPPGSLLKEGYAERVIQLWNVFTQFVFYFHPIAHSFLLRENIYPSGITLNPDNTNPYLVENIPSLFTNIQNLFLGIKLSSHYEDNLPKVNIDYIFTILNNRQILWTKVIKFFNKPPTGIFHSKPPLDYFYYRFLIHSLFQEKELFDLNTFHVS